MVCDVILALPPLCGCWMPFRSVMRWDGGYCRRGIRLRVDQGRSAWWFHGEIQDEGWDGRVVRWLWSQGVRVQ